ncbi:hypothetical protein H9P43_001353 [Blastocladiella emersonii ATCC 22665]|nr:hypothetical protein H9P43_001353 [Blastocladiella emersonii ATCC 22665]
MKSKKHATDNTSDSEGEGAVPSLYVDLGVAEDASDDDIKRAYRKLAMRFHPDKLVNATADEQAAAKAKFQAVSFAYTVLSDPSKRKRYDATGSADDLPAGLTGLDSDDAEAYFRDLYASCVTAETIAAFHAEYAGSPEERADILAAYAQGEGSMAFILENVPCTSVDDEDRIRALVMAAIEGGEVPAHRAFTHEDKRERAKRKREADEEAMEAEALAKEMGLRGGASKRAKTAKASKGKDGDEDDDEDLDALRQLIHRRQNQREAQFGSLVDRLEAKYASGPCSSKSKAKAKKPAPAPAPAKKKAAAPARKAGKPVAKSSSDMDEEDEVSAGAGSDESDDGGSDWESASSGGDLDEEDEVTDDEPAVPLQMNVHGATTFARVELPSRRAHTHAMTAIDAAVRRHAEAKREDIMKKYHAERARRRRSLQRTGSSGSAAGSAAGSASASGTASPANEPSEDEVWEAILRKLQKEWLIETKQIVDMNAAIGSVPIKDCEILEPVDLVSHARLMEQKHELARLQATVLPMRASRPGTLELLARDRLAAVAKNRREAAARATVAGKPPAPAGTRAAVGPYMVRTELVCMEESALELEVMARDAAPVLAGAGVPGIVVDRTET